LTVYTYKNNASFARFGPGGTTSIDTSHIAAVANGNEIHVNMKAFKMEGVKDFRWGHFLEALAHEYGHNLHHTVTTDPPPVPKWFSEGFAGWIAANVLQSLEWQDYNISLHRALRELAYHRDIPLSLSSLDDPKTWNDQSGKPKAAIKAYALATVALHGLIQREGLLAVMNYFQTGIFAVSFRVSWEEFVKDFDNYISELGIRKTVAFKIERPEWRIGDSWLHSRRVPGKITRLQREIIDEKLFRSVACFVIKQGEQEILYTKDTLSQLVNMEDGKLTTSRDKPNAVLNWPLEQGKEWRNSYKFEDLKKKTSGMVDRLMVVVNLETIKVSAGVFDTARVEAHDPETGRLVAEYWYSPKVKWMVKARSYDSIDGFTEDELVSFKVAEDQTGRTGS
jgi:hypothetical protein